MEKKNKYSYISYTLLCVDIYILLLITNPEVKNVHAA
jgi:hypothetical protein